MILFTYNKIAKHKRMISEHSGLRSALCLVTMTLFCCASLHAQVKGGEQSGKSKPKLAHVYQNALILSNGGLHTVLPLNSIIYQPSKNQSKVVEIPSGKFRFWPDFLVKNQDWIHTFEVTLDQAKGKKPIPSRKIEEFAKLNRTVIATYRQNPISVLSSKTDDSSAQVKEKK